MNAMDFKKVAAKKLSMFRRGLQSNQQIYLYMFGVIDTLQALELYTDEHEEVYKNFTAYLLGTPEVQSKAKEFFFN